MARPLSQAQQRELLSRWESRGADGLAPLSGGQQEALLELVTKSAAVEPPPPPASPAATPTAASSAEPSRLHLAHRIETSQQFLEWFQQVEANMERDQEQTYRVYGELLREYRRQCQDALEEIERALTYLKELTALHESASTKTNTLHEACQKLVEDQNDLLQYADTLARRLSYFAEHERIQKKLNSPTLSVLSEQFIPLLSKIDECIAFLKEHANYQDAPTYLLRFQQLQSKALGLVRAHVTNTLKTATQNVMTQIQTPTPGTAAADVSASGGGSFTLFYGKFRMHAPRIRTLMEELESRKPNSPDYYVLLEGCYDCYFQQRATLLMPSLTAAIADIVKQNESDLPKLMRAGCAHMVRVCVNEHQLYQHFFSRVHPGLEQLLDHLSRVLYEAVRPLYLKRAIDLDTLVELCNVLNVEVLDDKGQEVVAFASVAAEMLGDVQERLALRAADSYLQKHIRGFSPSADDLNYPDKLINAAAAAAAAAAFSSSPISSTSPTATTATYPHIPPQVTGWYPPLTQGVLLLSKLYQALDRKVYEALAQEILTSVLEALATAYHRIKASKGDLNGQLFLIKHLLALREQIAPFEGNFAVRQVTVDFNTLRLAAQSLLSDVNWRNSLLSMVTGAMPLVSQTEVDARKEVDEALRQVCQELIHQTSKVLGQPLSSFLVLVDALPPARRSNLAQESFATPARVTTLLAAQAALLQEILPQLKRQLELYLGGAGSDVERVLFRPIKATIIDLYKRLFSVIQSYYTATEQAEIANLPTLSTLESLVSLGTLSRTETPLPTPPLAAANPPSQSAALPSAKDGAPQRLVEDEANGKQDASAAEEDSGLIFGQTGADANRHEVTPVSAQEA